LQYARQDGGRTKGIREHNAKKKKKKKTKKKKGRTAFPVKPLQPNAEEAHAS
jgi:hypothetical protein